MAVCYIIYLKTRHILTCLPALPAHPPVANSCHLFNPNKMRNTKQTTLGELWFHSISWNMLCVDCRQSQVLSLTIMPKEGEQ